MYASTCQAADSSECSRDQPRNAASCAAVHGCISGDAVIQAHRVALTLVVTGPPVGLPWTAAALASHIAIRHAPPWHWPGVPPLSFAVFPAIGAALLIVVWSALATIAATGKLARWLPASPRIAATTAATTGLGAAAADLAIRAALT